MYHAGVAFIGPIRSGKSTMATAMAQKYGGTKLSFADALREEVADMLSKYVSSVPSEQSILKANMLIEMTNPGLKKKYRTILQWWGTEFRREICHDENYWVNKLVDKIATTATTGPFWVDDCRFANEYNMLRKLGFYFVKLEPNPDETEDVASVSKHASEEDWSRFDVNAYITWKPIEERVDAISRFLENAKE